MKKAQKKAGIVAFAFGSPGWILPNSLIVEIATKKARELGVPIYTQRDIDLAVYIARGGKAEYIKEKPNTPPSTVRIAKGAIMWAKRLGIKELWVVAARPHHWRCFRDLEKIAKGSEIGIHVCNEIMEPDFNEWFSESSTQKHTRSKESWERRERILRLMPFWFYKLVTS